MLEISGRDGDGTRGAFQAETNEQLASAPSVVPQKRRSGYEDEEGAIRGQPRTCIPNMMHRVHVSLY